VDRVLAVIDFEKAQPDAEIEQLVQERHEARAAGDYQRADSIREQLDRLGVQLVDTPGGTQWQRTNRAF
jgi:cysteinyl-tRNA synthetase